MDVTRPFLAFLLLALMLGTTMAQSRTFLVQNDAGFVFNFHPISRYGDNWNTFAFRIYENMPNGTMVGSIMSFSGAGRDMERNATCSLNTDKFRLFLLSPGLWQVLTNRVLDRELQEQVIFQITCQRTDPPQDSLVMTLVAHVLDTNDNAPQFPRPVFDFSVRENAEAGTFVGQVRAMDADEGDNAVISYSLDPSPYFRIDQEGRITVFGRLDRERSPLYQLTVHALNGQWERHAQVNVHIQDVNDNAPYSEQAAYMYAVGTGAAVGTQLGTIRVIDRDTGRNAEITATLQASTQGDSNLFSLQQASSNVIHLTTAGQLGPDTVGQHRLTVLAADRGVPSRTTTIPVTVTVMA